MFGPTAVSRRLSGCDLVSGIGEMDLGGGRSVTPGEWEERSLLRGR